MTANTIKTLIGNVKGPKGDKGDKGTTGATGPAGQKGDTGETGATGAKGATGQRGSRWSQGTAITGTSTTATVFSGSKITDALANDNYLNTSTGNTYRCTVAGNASTAKWVYTGNIKGAKGDTGATGPAGPAGASATTAEKVKYTKTNGSESTVQAELTELNGNMELKTKVGTGVTVLFNRTILFLRISATIKSAAYGNELTEIALPEGITTDVERNFFIPIMSENWWPTNKIAFLIFRPGKRNPILRISDDSVANIILVGTIVLPRDFFNIS